MDAICEHIIFVENLKFIIMKLLRNKKYYELTAKIYEQEQELTRKNTHIDALENKCDLVSKLAEQNQQLSAIVSELEPIVEKFNHKKNLEKARKQKYIAKLKLQKKQPTEPIPSIYKMSRQEKFAMENIGKEVVSGYNSGISGIGYVAGYHNKDQYILIGFKDNSGWQDKKTRPECVILKKYKTYWYVQIEKVKFKQ